MRCDYWESEEQLKRKAKEDEIRSWKENRVYEETERNGEHGLSTRWIMTKEIKQGEEKWKAKLVVRGFEGRKLTEKTEAPTCSGEGLKLCLSVIKREKWKVRAIDVKTAYLQGKNIEYVVKPPREAKTEKLWKLRKAVYGLKDAARVLYETVVGMLAKMGRRNKQVGPNIICLEEERKNHWCYGDTCG